LRHIGALIEVRGFFGTLRLRSGRAREAAVVGFGERNLNFLRMTAQKMDENVRAAGIQMKLSS